MNRLYVVGIGPGDRDGCTLEAEGVLRECEVIVGYTVYVELVQKMLTETKEYITTGMKQEIERVRQALELANAGRQVALVCSGDAAVYGLAGLALELGADYPQVEVRTVAGVTAALSGSARLGAMLGHDFAVISLSDLLTPWEVIEKRLMGAALGDMVICLYNPSSRKRTDHLRRACEICLKYKSEDTVCGIVRNIGREGESTRILSLKELQQAEVDMFTTVYIGNSETKVVGTQVVTPRGYERKLRPEDTEAADITAAEAEPSYDMSGFLPDEAFLRNAEKHVPMTKYPIRVLAVNELKLTETAVAYDIGAGTGSVTIEMARKAKLGHIYAVEKKPEAVQILTDNIEHFHINNITIVEGRAPEVLAELPAPDCVCIGGSSGEVPQIIRAVRE